MVRSYFGNSNRYDLADSSRSGGKRGPAKSKHTESLAELEQYKLLVDSVQEYAIFLLDTRGFIRTWNQGANKINGYTADEIIGKHFSIFYRERDKNSHKPERELELARQNGRIEDEDWRVRKDGTHFWANVVITALYDQGKKLVGYAKVTRDLTARKQFEDELREANARLLRQRMELEKMNVSKDEFISLASHQLRTPATSVKQYLGMLLEGFAGELSENQRSFVQRAFESNEQQIEIVNTLLKVAQVDGGKVVLSKLPIDVNALIHDVLEDYSDTFRLRGQTSGERLAQVGAIDADPLQFRMVLENLIDNASKYTPRGGSIEVETKQDGDMVTITVCDTGVGISAADQGRLFGKFTRIRNKLSDSVSGSGLGLYWVKKIIELHGGTIGVKSEPDEGTTMIVTMPVSKEAYA